MANILFTHSYFYKFDAKQWSNQAPYPPYGTIYAAALMRQEGHEVELFDTNLKDDPNLIQPYLDQTQPKYLVIYDDGFNYLTKMCLTKMREAAFHMAKLGKKKGAKIIVCSSDSTDHFQKYLDEGADFIMIGEGEITLKELVEALENGETNFHQIPGIAFKESDSNYTKTLKRPILKQLDTLPDPAWDLVEIDEYKKIWMDHHGYFSLNMATTRGCPYKCNWCAKPIYGNRYNTRSPQRVADELERHHINHGASHFWMADDIFGLKPGWVQEFRDIIQEKNLNIKYKIQSRVDLLLKEDNLDALAASGLEEVWVGAESGSQKILDAMDKGTKIEQIYEATRLLKKKGIRVAFFLQFGYLGETQEDIQKTINMVTELLPDDIGISVSYPLPGTKFYDKVKATFQGKENWTDSDDLDMMFLGTYNSAYYKRLHRYVHKTYRKHQGWDMIRQIISQPSKANTTKIRRALSTLYYIPTSKIDEYQLKKLEIPSDI